MGIDLGAVVAAGAGARARAVGLLAVQGVARVVAQVLVVRLPAASLLLLQLGAILERQRRRLRLRRLSVAARLEAVVAAVQGQAVVAVAVVAVAVGLGLDGHKRVGQRQRRQQRRRAGRRGNRGRRRAASGCRYCRCGAGHAQFPLPLALRDVMTAECAKDRHALVLWCFGVRLLSC